MNVEGLSDARAISAGSKHTCAIAGSGQAFCWGSNIYGELGNGTTNRSLVPSAVTGLTDSKDISAGPDSSCATTATSEAFCWGSNGSGQLGNGTVTSSLLPTPVLGLTDAGSISVGATHACAVREPSGRPVCWGRTSLGQLGNGTSMVSGVPVKVSLPLSGAA